jgi:hypothetical protein
MNAEATWGQRFRAATELPLGVVRHALTAQNRIWKTGGNAKAPAPQETAYER